MTEASGPLWSVGRGFRLPRQSNPRDWLATVSQGRGSSSTTRARPGTTTTSGVAADASRAGGMHAVLIARIGYSPAKETRVCRDRCMYVLA